MFNVAELGFVVDGRPLRGAKNELHGVGRAAKGASKEVDSFSASATKAGKASGVLARGAGRLAVGLAASVGAAVGFGRIVSSLAGFDTSMAKVKAISGATAIEFKAMRDIAKELGSTTEFSASQAADGLAFLSMAGFEASESVSALPAVLDLATASGLGLAEAADIASNIMSGFGIAAQNTAQVTDVLAKASSMANTNVSQLGFAMSYAAPIADSLGISIGDTAAAIGVLSDAGVQGGRGGVALRAILTKLASPAKEAQDVLASLGLTISDIDPKANSLGDVLETLGGKNINLAQATKLVGMEAASNLLILTKGTAKYKEYSQELSKATGASSAMAKIMRDGLGADLNGLMSAVEGLILTLGEAGLTAALRGLVQGLTYGVRKAADGIKFLAENVDILVIALGVLAASKIPAVIVVTTTMIARFATLETLMIAGAIASRGLGGAMAFLAAQSGLVAAAMNAIPLVAVITGITVLYRAFSNSSKAARGFKASISAAKDAQNALNDATENYYKNISRANLDAMVKAAQERLKEAKQVLVDADRELSKGKWLKTSLFVGDERKALEKAKIGLIDAQNLLSKAEHAQANFERRVADGTYILGKDTETVQKRTQVLAEMHKAVSDLTSDISVGSAPARESIMALAREYGALSLEMWKAIEAQRELAVADAMAGARAMIKPMQVLMGEIAGADAQGQAFRATMEALSAAQTPEQMARAFFDAASQIEQGAGGVVQMDDETRRLYGSVLSVAQELSRAVGIARQGAGAVSPFTSAINRAAAAAARLWAKLSGAVGALGVVRRGLSALGVGSAIKGITESKGLASLKAAALEAFQGARNIKAGLTFDGRSKAPVGGGGRGGGGGGGGGSGTGSSKPFDFWGPSDEEMQRLRDNILYLGKTKEEVAALKAERQMLNRARKNGLNLDAVEAESGQTLRESISQRAQEIGKLTDKYQELRDRQDGLGRGVDQFVNALVKGGNAVKNFVAQALLEFGKFQISQGLKMILGLKTEKTGGGFLGDIFRAFSGAHDKGGNIGSRQWGIVGERGPEIVRGPAHVTSRVDTARILNGAARARPAPQGLDIKVGVSVDGNGNLMPFVESVAERKAVAASQVMGRQIDQNLPRRVRQIRDDPRKI